MVMLMKIMTNLELISRMKELLKEPNYYGSGGSNWSTFINGGWYVDCTCSIKAILWGGRFTPANRNKAHAGCKYGSNNVPDFTPSSCVQWTKATNGNFSTLVPGEILLMTSHGHAGLYIGNGEVIEVTPAWTGGTPGCQVSKIGKNGERFKNGRQVYSWEYHGRIPVVEYVVEPKPTPAPTPKKSVAEIAKEIVYGKNYGGWGIQPERQQRLEAAGYNFTEVQAEVNKLVNTNKPKPALDLLTVVKKTIRGDYGNMPGRKTQIEAAGYNYAEVQRQVNLNIQHGLTHWDNIKLF